MCFGRKPAPPPPPPPAPVEVPAAPATQASPEVKAARKNEKIAAAKLLKEAKKAGKVVKKFDSKIKLLDAKKALRIRNISDTKRKNSPLLKHRDSIEIDTGKLNKSSMLAKMSKYVKRVVKEKYGE